MLILPNLKKVALHISTIMLLGLLLSTAACSDNNEPPEVINPLNCTIPGELQLNSETIERLKQYEIVPL